jgi:hypothetical protein
MSAAGDLLRSMPRHHSPNEGAPMTREEARQVADFIEDSLDEAKWMFGTSPLPAGTLSASN